MATYSDVTEGRKFKIRYFAFGNISKMSLFLEQQDLLSSTDR